MALTLKKFLLKTEKSDFDILYEKIQKKERDAINMGIFTLYSCEPIRKMIRVAEKEKKIDLLTMVDDICSNWMRYCDIPYEAGMKLNEMAMDPDVSIGVHRTFIPDLNADDCLSSDIVRGIIENGLHNMGHLNVGGSVGDKPSLTLTLTPLESIEGFLNLVAPYKNNNITVITKFPTDLVDKDLHLLDENRIDELYYQDMNTTTVRPEFIYGIIIKRVGEVSTFYTREELLKGKTK